MRNDFDRKLTMRRKAAGIAALLIIAFALWYVLLYLLVRERIYRADTAELEDAMMLEELRTAKLLSMQEEIKANQEAGAPVVPSYDNFKEEAKELNTIFGRTDHLKIEFAAPELDGMTVRRNAEVSCTVKDYEHATDMLHELLNGKNRVMIHEISVVPAKENDNGNNVLEGAVNLSFLLTYYETTADAESAEGLTVEKNDEKEQTE